MTGSPVGLGVSIAVCGAAIVLAVGTIPLVLRVPRRQNRRLAVVLAVEATMLTMMLSGAVRELVLVGKPWKPPSDAVNDLGALFIPGVVSVYILFIATLETPLVRWIRSRAATAVILAYPLATYGYALSYVEDFAPEPTGAEAFVFLTTIGLFIASNLFCLVASIDAWRRAAAGSLARSRARAFAVAFGTRDAMLATVLGTWILLGFGKSPFAEIGWDVLEIGLPLSFLVYLLLLAYGILRTQLFDIDLKVKRGLKQGTVMGVFVAAFFVVSEAAQAFFGDATGSQYVGIVAAGALVFAIAPLQRMAERVADRAMPHVRESGAYVAYRKVAVYRAAVEGAYEDGEITPRERGMLERLARELALASGDVASVESEIAAARATPTAGRPTEALA